VDGQEHVDSLPAEEVLHIPDVQPQVQVGMQGQVPEVVRLLAHRPNEVTGPALAEALDDLKTPQDAQVAQRFG
jgi:hypothetical protein